MNRKASEILRYNVIYWLLLILFIVPLSIFIWLQMNSAVFWSDFYAKELSRVVNLAQAGDEMSMNIQKLTEIAARGGVPNNDVFTFNNQEKEICVKLSKGRKTCYNYFNDVNVVEINALIGGEVNRLEFKIQEEN